MHVVVRYKITAYALRWRIYLTWMRSTFRLES